MTDEHQQGTYTHGYSQSFVQEQSRRQANREGAFFLPYLHPGMRLVDVGCGPGTITVGFAPAVAPAEVLGIDLEPSVIEQARALAKERGITNVRFEVGRAEELPAVAESYDAAIEHTLLEHLADPLSVLQEMRRVLRPGGVIGLADGDWGGWLVEPRVPAMIEAFALYERVWRHNGGNPRFGRHQRALLRQAGFRYGPTTLHTYEYMPADAEEMATAPSTAYERAIELGWTDRSAIERYAEGIRTWGKHPDALWIAPIVQTVAWRI